MKFKRLVAGALVLGLLTSTLLARPGVVVLTTDKTITGDITEQADTVTVRKNGTTQTLARSAVKQILYDQSIDEQFQAQYAKLGPKDVAGRLALAKFASDNGRADLAYRVLSEAKVLDPTNKDIDAALDGAKRQGGAATPTTQATTEPTKVATTQESGPPPLEWRLLNAEEINVVRQKEMSTDDPRIRVRFENKVIQRYLAGTGMAKAEFDKKSQEDQALLILAANDPLMTKDVKVMTDPTQLFEFKTKAMPMIVQACGSQSCHGGTKGGKFALYQGDSAAALYTNFYILTQYKAVIDGVQYSMVDRDTRDRSLLLTFGQPVIAAKPPHPPVPGFKPRFKTVEDPAYLTVYSWAKTLREFQPDYSFKVAIHPTTQPTK